MTSAILPIPNEKQIAINGMCWAAVLSPIIKYCTGNTDQPTRALPSRRPPPHRRRLDR